MGQGQSSQVDTMYTDYIQDNNNCSINSNNNKSMIYIK